MIAGRKHEKRKETGPSESAQWSARFRLGARWGVAGILIQSDCRWTRFGEDHTGASNNVREREGRATRSVLHRAGRAGDQDAAISAAVQLLRSPIGRIGDPVHQPKRRGVGTG